MSSLDVGDGVSGADVSESGGISDSVGVDAVGVVVLVSLW